MMMHSCTVKSRFIYLFTLLILVGTLNAANGNRYFAVTIQASASVSSPLVILQNISNSEVSETNTSATVTVSNGTADLDVLGVLNQASDDWSLQLLRYNDSNINRLVNFTIWFSNGSTASKQIEIADGQFIQTSGSYYELVGGGVDKITLTASTNTTGTSYVYAYLKILEPNTSKYALYVITFEII